MSRCACRTPNINIFRDPRWGRGQETPGEDTYLSSEYVYYLIRGYQEGEDSRFYKIVADCKVSLTAALQSPHRRIAAVRCLTRPLLSRGVLVPRSLAYVP